MFSSFSQHSNNLIYSQRFYYNNYEYYNDYQKLQTKYKDDLSKVIFRLNRKTKGTIFYQWNDQQSPKIFQADKNSQSMDVQTKTNENLKNQLGIEMLLGSVLQNFYQQNYSNIKLDQQSKKQLYEFVHLKYINHLNQHDDNSQEQSTFKYERNSIQVLNKILKKEAKQKLSYYEAIGKMQSFRIDDDQMFLERWNAFENLGFYFLEHQLIKRKNTNVYKEQLKTLYRFATKVRFIVERTLAANYFNSLFINLPNLKKTNKIFHPLTMALNYTNTFFEPKNGFQNKPKIVFLNLDGRQTPYNLRYARNIGENFMYVSIFKQPSHMYKKSQKMQYQFQSGYDTTFSNVSECYSRLLINEAFPQQELFQGNDDKFENKSKMLLFPMNSQHLRRQYYKNINSKSRDSNRQRQFPVLQTSNDIYFLFQTVIFEEIRQFNPNFIMVSYNGFLNLDEDHWNEIVKNLTIIGDHKICMYVDFIDRLGGKKTGQDEQQSEQQQDQEQEQGTQQFQGSQIIEPHQQGQQEQSQEEEEQQLDELKVRNIQVIRQFMGKYMRLKHFWPYLQHERVLNGILMFMKISSGAYSMQPRLLLSHRLKFTLGQRYAYLEGLGNSKEMGPVMVKYVCRLLKSEEIGQLYSNQAKIQLKQNRKENQSYQKLIDNIILQFLNEQNRRERFSHNPKLLYRLQEVLQEQQYENTLKYGTDEDHNPQYSSNISNSIQTDIRQPSIMHQYLKEMKRKLLLENLQTYRFKKYFYYEEEPETSHHSLIPQQKVKCYKFYLYEDDSQEISFQKYTQFFFDTKKAKVYIINYKATDERHLILYGSIIPTSYQKKYNIKVQIAKESQRQLNSPLHSLFQKDSQMDLNQQSQLSPKKDLVFVNYSHCFVKNKLYLYWPQKWSIRDEIRHKILGLKYKPENVNIIVKVELNHQNQCVYETIQLKDQQKTYVYPRIGCSSYQIPSQNDQFFIFGGVQDNENDFFDSGEAMYQVLIKEGSSYFSVKPLPKTKQKSTKQSSINVMNLIKKNTSFALRLRPKMNYRIQRFVETGNGSQQNKLIISGGFGRQFTNYFNFFSSDSYLFNPSTKLLESKEIHPRRLIKVTKPIQINRVGKFYLITNSQNIQEVQQNFSDLPKDLFVFEYRAQKSNKQGPGNQLRESRQSSLKIQGPNNHIISQNFIAKYFQNRQVHSFIDERYRTLDSKIDSKKIYLCGFNRTVREKIYSKFWSPQLYVVDGNQSSIVHISLKTQKSYSYNISNFLMPRQEDIVSLCIDQDRLYVLSSSPVIHSIQFSNSKYVLYEGNLSNMNDITNKHELQMHQKFDFKKQKEFMLKYKTLYSFDEKIYLFGGLAVYQDPSILTLTSDLGMDVEGRMTNKVSYREDYILEKEKNKFVLKTRKVQAVKDTVQMTSPVIVKFNELLYFYSIEMTETIIKKQSPFPEIKENYKIKIQEFSSESSAQGKCMSQTMKFYTWDGLQNKIIRIIPRLNEPKFVCISKHQFFNMSKFKEHLQKAVIRLRKRIEESTIQDEKLNDLYSKCLILLKQRNQELIISTLEAQNKFFKQMINSIRPQSIQKQRRDIEEQQLIKDLKICYSLVIKLIIQRLIQRAKAEEIRFQSNLSSRQSNLENSVNFDSSMSLGTSNESMKRQRLVQKMQKLSLSAEQVTAQYRFIVEDSKLSRKIRYIAIGPLANVQELRFFRIRFKHDVSLCLNKTNQDGFYYHPTLNACEEIDLNDKYAQYDIMEEDQIKNDSKSHQQYKLFCQLKL